MLCQCGRPECFICGLIARRPEYAERFANAKLALSGHAISQPASTNHSTQRPPPPARADCVYLGSVLSSTDATGAHTGCSSKWLRECERLDECRIDTEWNGPRCFTNGTPTCGDYCSKSSPPPDLRGEVETKLLAKFDEHNLKRLSGKVFNPSLVRDGDGYIFAFRTGWAGSEIVLTRLTKDLEQIGPHVQLPLSRRGQSAYGREDPRLFWHKRQLHVMFTGVNGRTGPTNVLFARLSADLRVEDLFFPRVPGRHSWEKNHAYFDVSDELFAVYDIEGHRVMRVQSENVEFVYSGQTPKPWNGGQPRGGASPVLVGDEWWHFFHSRRERDGHRIYEMGLYTFSVTAPFHPLRIIPEPLMIANRSTKPLDQYASVVWPGGAVRDGDRWIIALGIHDRWSELHSMSHAELESRLIPVT